MWELPRSSMGRAMSTVSPMVWTGRRRFCSICPARPWKSFRRLTGAGWDTTICRLWRTQSCHLPGCITAAESGFSSYEQIAQDSGIEGELAAIEAQAAELETRINEGALSQSELTQAAGELYSLWDAELNSIWERIGALLPKEEMAQLTSEELAWIQEKETAVAQAGAEFEGGSMQPFIENSTAARLTRERVYELAVYLGYTGESDGGQTDSGTAYGLEPDTVYMLDFDGDGTQERFSFSTYTQENDGMSRAVLELSVDGQTVWSVTERLELSMACQPLDGGSAVYLAACSSSDNDWTSQALLLEYTGDSFGLWPISAPYQKIRGYTGQSAERLGKGERRDRCGGKYGYAHLDGNVDERRNCVCSGHL